MAHKQILALSMGGLAVLGSVAALGMAPVNAAVAEQMSTTVTIGIASFCDITAGGGAATINLTPTTSAVSGTSTDTALQFTCNQAGTIKWGMGTTNGTAFTSGSTSLASGTNYIAGVGTAGAANVGTNQWGVKFNTPTNATLSGVNTTSYFTPSTSLVTIATFAASGAAGSMAKTYAAQVDTTLPSGTYTGTVVYSLETN